MKDHAISVLNVERERAVYNVTALVRCSVFSIPPTKTSTYPAIPVKLGFV